MEIQFIEIELSLAEVESVQLNRYINQQLSNYGKPLRWAIVAVDPINKIAKIEAIVTSDLR
jgi:hypothetical protein